MSFFANNFLLCPGVEKCGTTSLHALLSGQAGLSVPDRKELFFFNSEFDRGEEYYQSLFPGSGAGHVWYADITPSYFRRPKTLERIRSSLSGDVAVLFMIRNPVKRAFSFYWHDMVRHFLRGEKSARGFEAFVNCSFTHFVQLKDPYYFTTYADALTQWMEAFPGRCAVHLTEEVVLDPSGLISDINRLCGLKLAPDLAFPRENSSFIETISIFPKGIRRHTEDGTKPMLLPRQRAINAMAMQGTFTHFVPRARCEEIYTNFFAEDIRRCEDLLGRDLSVFAKQSNLVSPIVKGYTHAVP